MLHFIIELGNVTKDVFKKYFEKVPPFGEKKKKHEFPDAFVIESLQRKAKSIGKVIFVVSDDPDYDELEKHYDSLKSFKNIDEVLDICIRGIIEKSNTLNDEDIERWIDENSLTIESEVRDKIEDVSFDVNDLSGEIEDVFCSDVKINRKYIIDITEDEITVSLNLTCTVTLGVSYDNPERARFRSEEEEECIPTRCDKNITQDFNVDCELKLNYDTDSGKLDLSEIELEPFDDTVKIS